MAKKTFGQFKKELHPGNKQYHVYHSGEVDGKDVHHYTSVTANNRDEAHAHASKEFKKKHPNVKNITADHIGTEQLKEATDPNDRKFRFMATISIQDGAGRMAKSRVITKDYMAYTEDEARAKAKAWCEASEEYAKVLDIEKAPQQYHHSVKV